MAYISCDTDERKTQQISKQTLTLLTVARIRTQSPESKREGLNIPCRKRCGIRLCVSASSLSSASSSSAVCEQQCETHHIQACGEVRRNQQMSPCPKIVRDRKFMLDLSGGAEVTTTAWRGVLPAKEGRTPTCANNRKRNTIAAKYFITTIDTPHPLHLSQKSKINLTMNILAGLTGDCPS